MKIKKVVEGAFISMSISMMAWAIFSWVEVIAKNLQPDPQYSAINMFDLLLKLREVL